MGRNLPVIFWTRKFWKIRAFDYNQHIISMMYTNARFQSIGTTSDFGTTLPKIVWMTKRLKK